MKSIKIIYSIFLTKKDGINKMKNYFLAITFYFTLFTFNLFAQWQPDVRLTNAAYNSYTTYNNAWCIASSGDVVHVVWFDLRDLNYEIYYKRSTNGGIVWGADTRLTSNSAVSRHPSVAVSGQVVHVVWDDDRNVNPEIYYKRSTDGGVSWGADTRLTNNPAVSTRPSISVSGQVVHVVWTDTRDGNYEIYYKLNPTGNTIGIININSGIPNQFSLSQNYPNPFNPNSKIKFQIAKLSDAKLVVFDVLSVRRLQHLLTNNLNPAIMKLISTEVILQAGFIIIA